MKTRRVLVVGHGYLGQQLSEVLHRCGVSVTAVHRGAPGWEGYPIHRGDVTSQESLRTLAQTVHPEDIVLCASSGRGGAESYHAVFVEGVGNLQAVFPGVPILFTSSTSVYGQTDGSTVDERSATEPDRETGRLLLEAEDAVRAGGGIALRLAGLYGPGRSVHLQRLLEGTARIEDAEPSRILNQIHRDDAAAAIVHLLGADREGSAGTVLNVVDGTALSQRECYEGLARLLNLPTPPLSPPDPDRKRGWTHKIVSNAALRATGWTPQFPSFLRAVSDDPRLLPSIRARLEENP